MSLLICAELAFMLLGLLLSGIDGAVLVEGTADTQHFDDTQRSRFVRREQRTEEGLADIPHNIQAAREDAMSVKAKQLQQQAKVKPAQADKDKPAPKKGKALAKVRPVQADKEKPAHKKAKSLAEIPHNIEGAEAGAESVKAKQLHQRTAPKPVQVEQVKPENKHKDKPEHKKVDKVAPQHKAQPLHAKAEGKATSKNSAPVQKKTGEATNLLADEARQKVEKVKLESLQKVRRLHREKRLETSNEGGEGSVKSGSEEVHRATPLSLPEVAFAPDAWVVEDKEAHLANLMKIIRERQGAKGEDEEDNDDPWCDSDFPLGIWNTSLCSSDGATDHILIEDEAECTQAAAQANATAGDGNNMYFRIPKEWRDMHPKGCFFFPCTWDPGNICYWFNPIGDTPRYPWGAPVCSRPLIRNGTLDTNNGCPYGYDVIADANTCSQAAGCKAYCTQNDFLVGVEYPVHNASQHNKFPENCFIHKEQGCVYYNPSYGPNPPQEPKGTPLCNVTQITHFPEIALPWDIFW